VSCVTIMVAVPWSAAKRGRRSSTRPPALAVERARRFIDDQDRWTVHQRPRDVHPLPLSAGELSRPLLGELGESDLVKQVRRARPRLAFLAPTTALPEPGHNEHLLEGRQRRDEVRLLEHDPEVLASQTRSLAARQSCSVVLVTVACEYHESAITRTTVNRVPSRATASPGRTATSFAIVAPITLVTSREGASVDSVLSPPKAATRIVPDGP
jgi:hypothetical protein